MYRYLFLNVTPGISPIIPVNLVPVGRHQCTIKNGIFTKDFKYNCQENYAYGS